jgi:hypothetical protein
MSVNSPPSRLKKFHERPWITGSGPFALPPGRIVPSPEGSVDRGMHSDDGACRRAKPGATSQRGRLTGLLRCPPLAPRGAGALHQGTGVWPDVVRRLEQSQRPAAAPSRRCAVAVTVAGQAERTRLVGTDTGGVGGESGSVKVAWLLTTSRRTLRPLTARRSHHRVPKPLGRRHEAVVW